MQVHQPLHSHAPSVVQAAIHLPPHTRLLLSSVSPDFWANCCDWHASSPLVYCLRAAAARDKIVLRGGRLVCYPGSCVASVQSALFCKVLRAVGTAESLPYFAHALDVICGKAALAVVAYDRRAQAAVKFGFFSTRDMMQPCWERKKNTRGQRKNHGRRRGLIKEQRAAGRAYVTASPTIFITC